MAKRQRERRYKTGIPVICPKCKKKTVFFATGSESDGDAVINIFCKTCKKRCRSV